MADKGKSKVNEWEEKKKESNQEKIFRVFNSWLDAEYEEIGRQRQSNVDGHVAEPPIKKKRLEIDGDDDALWSGVKKYLLENSEDILRIIGESHVDGGSSNMQQVKTEVKEEEDEAVQVPIIPSAATTFEIGSSSSSPIENQVPIIPNAATTFEIGSSSASQIENQVPIIPASDQVEDQVPIPARPIIIDIDEIEGLEENRDTVAARVVRLYRRGG